jgi:hypothetical protein
MRIETIYGVRCLNNREQRRHDSPRTASLPDSMLQVVSKLTERDEHARRVQKGAVVLNLVVVAGYQVTEVVQPGIGPFDDPAAAVASETAAILIAVNPRGAMRYNQLDAAALQSLPQFDAVIAPVCHDALGPLLWSAGPGPRDGYVSERFFRELRLGSIGR